MFIGNKEIIEAQTAFSEDGKTVNVEYSDMTRETMTKLMYDASLTKTPLDATDLRDHQMKPIVIGIISLLLDYNIKVTDVQYVSALVTTSLQEWEVEADKMKWGGLGKRQITISDIDKTLKGM